MKYMPPGTLGLLLGFGTFGLVRFIADKQTGPSVKFTFDPKGVPGTFEPRFANYIRAVETNIKSGELAYRLAVVI